MTVKDAKNGLEGGSKTLAIAGAMVRIMVRS
jgi:hypothetical protein